MTPRAWKDPALPVLDELSPTLIDRITGRNGCDLLRLRYRPGARAVLHVTCPRQDQPAPPAPGAAPAETAGLEGVIWFFAGRKARKVARQNRRAIFHADTGGLYERFPDDHRLPQLRHFIEDYARVAPALLQGPSHQAPKLLRYRPGVSCTFRCLRDDGVVRYVKILREPAPEELLRFNEQMNDALRGRPVSVARIRGYLKPLRCVAYEEATGIPLDTVLARSGSAVEAARALGQTAAALATFSASSVAPSRLLGREELLERAESAARMIRFSFPQFGPTVEAALDRLHSDSRPLRSLPIHGDMKLEHAFLDEGRVMFIDTESVALGDPDYDLARLEARLLTARLTWQIGRHLYRAALQELAPRTGENYAWCRIVARLQAAKFFAQRPFASANRTVRALFRDLKLV